MNAPVPEAPDRALPRVRIEARRRLLKAGVAAAPVLTTLVSRPVLGTQCTTCSAFTSMTGSRVAAYSACTGRSPDTWAGTKTWPDPYHASDKNGANGYSATLYHCTTTGLNGTTFSPNTMLVVMQSPDDGGVVSLGRYIAAALLNARLGVTPVLSEALVRGMWNDYLARGYFEPTAGVRWGAADLVRYIRSTMS